MLARDDERSGKEPRKLVHVYGKLPWELSFLLLVPFWVLKNARLSVALPVWKALE